MRLFLAVELDSRLRHHLRRVQMALRPLAEGVSWPPEENLHLTLKFLGEVGEPLLPGISAALADIPVPPPMALNPAGLACFPDRGRINVITAALTGDLSDLSGLHDRIEAAMEQQGLAREERPYRPHVTLGRARRPLPAGLRSGLAEAAAPFWPGPTTHITGFALVHSRLGARGAHYAVAARFPPGPSAS